MPTRIIAGEQGIRNVIARMMVTPYLHVYDGLLLMMCPELEPGYEVWMEDLIMMVVTPKVIYSPYFRKELYDAVCGSVL